MTTKITDYTNSTKNLEAKIFEMTSKSEKCSICRHLVEDELLQTMNSVTLTSLREDTIQRVNVIPSLQVRNFIPRDEISSYLKINGTVPDNQINPEMGTNSTEFKIHIENKLNLNLPTGIKLSTNNSLKLGNYVPIKTNENFTPDENLGAAEYYEYLMKTVNFLYNMSSGFRDPK